MQNSSQEDNGYNVKVTKRTAAGQDRSAYDRQLNPRCPTNHAKFNILDASITGYNFAADWRWSTSFADLGPPLTSSLPCPFSFVPVRCLSELEQLGLRSFATSFFLRGIILNKSQLQTLYWSG
jgi:hypothetical protein